MISSTSNQKVKQIVRWREKSRERKADGVFVAEGSKMFLEAPLDWLREVYVSQTLLESLEKSADSALAAGVSRGAALWEKLERTGFETVSDEVFKKLSDTQTPQGILTVLHCPAYDLETLLTAKNPLFVVLEGLQDAGNLGTIVRTGEGAGITGVILSEDTVDIFNPKTVRATMGSIFRVPFVISSDLKETVGALKRAKVAVYAAHLGGEKAYDAFPLREPSAFLIGNEGRGLTEETARLADACLRIPMEGQVESLNAAVAAALLMYEAHRQRAVSG